MPKEATRSSWLSDFFLVILEDVARAPKYPATQLADFFWSHLGQAANIKQEVDTGRQNLDRCYDMYKISDNISKKT